LKIAITGTHGTGKTTLVNELKKHPLLNNFFFDINVTRWVHSLGFKINEETSGVGQEINMLKRVANLNSFNHYIADRSIFDVLAYTNYGFVHGSVSEDEFLYQRDLVKANKHKYNLLFLLKPEFSIKDDGVRAVDPAYQEKIQVIIENYIDLFSVKVIELSGTVEERKSIMLRHIGLQNLAWSV